MRSGISTAWFVWKRWILHRGFSEWSLEVWPQSAGARLPGTPWTWRRTGSGWWCKSMSVRRSWSAKIFLQFCTFCIELMQALFLCKFAWFFVQYWHPDISFFINASRNATDNHKYSLLASADFDSSGVLVSFSAFIFSKKWLFWLWEGSLRGWGRPP